jgi:hypothetical protein
MAVPPRRDQKGIDTIVINYRHQTGQLATEVLTFREGLVVSGMALTGAEARGPADASCGMAGRSSAMGHAPADRTAFFT